MNDTVANSEILDTIIIGAGPAGLAAAIYAARAELNFVVIERAPYAGGMIQSSFEVDNYPGLPDKTGPELAECFFSHCQKLGCRFEEGEVIDIQTAIGFLPCERNYFIINLTDGRFFTTKTVIVATGSTYKKLNVPGEGEFQGLGVSYCATCDGPLFHKKEVVIVGGGNVALESALYLSRFCSYITIVHRHPKPKADNVLVTRALATGNISFASNSEVIRIEGIEEQDESNQTSVHVSQVLVKNNVTDFTQAIPCSCVFVCIGFKTNTALFANICSVDSEGFIKATETGVTNCPGFFAAGDIRTKQKRQVLTAAADGANAVESVLKYLASEIPVNYRKC